jgi:glutamate carboxypeptidase
MRLVGFIFFILLPFTIHGASLTEKEQSIVVLVEEHESDARALLNKVVNINSGTMNLEGVTSIGDIFAEEYEKMGFKTEWIEGAAFQRAGHLVASFGNRGPKILLIGHLDTVFSKDSPLKQLEVLPGDKIKGPGIVDMKGGDVVMLTAIRALRDAGLLDQMSIKVILTGDEEKRGVPFALATKALIDAGIWAEIAIGFEDGDGDPKTAVVSRRGASGWELSVTGRPAHSSQVFREGYGVGAIYETARILNQFRETLSREPNLTFNPGVIVGGTESNLDTGLGKGEAYGKNNIIAQTTRVTGDIRALTPRQLVLAQKSMVKIANENLAETSAELVFHEGYPPMALTSGNKDLLALYNRVSLDLGFGEVTAVDPRKAGAADISFVAEYVEMAIDGLGLMGSGGHTKDELADMSTLNQQTSRAALLLHRLANQPPN